MYRTLTALLLLLYPAVSALAAASEGPESPGPDPMNAVLVLVAVFAFLFWRARKRKKASYSSLGKPKKGKPATWTTKNCPECEERIPLAAEKCEHCDKKQRAGDSTCSGGVNTAAEGRSFFAEERRNAKKVKSPGYIWRTAEDGGVCERCAANNGHQFSWDEEPPGGHAGAKARCRCYPETILSR